MNDRDSYAEMIHITMDTFKENNERNLAYMCSLLRLYEPPFQHGQWNVEDVTEAIQVDVSQRGVGAINNASEEDKSSRKH